MKLLRRVHKRDLQEIEENFVVKIVWKGNTTQVRISPRKAPNRLNHFQEGCDAFVDLYRKFHSNMGREEVELPNGTDEIRVVEVVSQAEAENPVIIEKVDKNLIVYAEKNKISSLVQSFKEKLGIMQDGSRKSKCVQGSKCHDPCEEHEAPPTTVTSQGNPSDVGVESPRRTKEGKVPQKNCLFHALDLKPH